MVKRTVKSVQLDAEIKLTRINAEIEDVLVGSYDKKRKFIETKTKTAVSDYNNFFTNLSKGDLSTVALWINSMSAYETASGGLSTHSLRTAYNKLKQFLNSPPSGTQSHSQTGILTSQLFIMYIELTRIVNSNFWSGFEQKELPTSSGQTKKWDLSSTRALTENIRQLYIASKAVSEMDIDGFTGDTIEDLRRGLKQYFDTTTPDQHLIKKEGVVNSLTGQINQKIVLEEQGDRSAADYLIGTAKNQAFEDKKNKDVEGVLNKYANDFAKIQGSKKIGDEVVKQLVTMALGKKPKPYSHKSDYKLKKSKVKDTISHKLNKGDLARKATKMPVLAAKVMQESGAEKEGQVSVVRLKSMINKRLPAEVRRNMGRPALINRTGRFSNSPQLLNLKQSAKGLSGDYTYLLNPYQTFENTGSKRWPIGYNPKALIAKSIRNLALQYTEQKVTILRRR